MTAQNHWFIRFSVLVLAVASLCSGCNTTNDEPLPPQLRVYVQVYLNTLETLPLKTPPSYIYIRNEGLRGIILYSDQPNSYIAIDRNCTFNVNDTCAVVSVDPSLQFYSCRCCGSRFGLRGNVLTGPAMNALRRYNVIQTDPNTLLISN